MDQVSRRGFLALLGAAAGAAGARLIPANIVQAAEQAFSIPASMEATPYPQSDIWNAVMVEQWVPHSLRERTEINEDIAMWRLLGFTQAVGTLNLKDERASLPKTQAFNQSVPFGGYLEHSGNRLSNVLNIMGQGASIHVLTQIKERDGKLLRFHSWGKVSTYEVDPVKTPVPLWFSGDLFQIRQIQDQEMKMHEMFRELAYNHYQKPIKEL